MMQILLEVEMADNVNSQKAHKIGGWQSQMDTTFLDILSWIQLIFS